MLDRPWIDREQLSRLRTLDRDRIILAALDTLESEALDACHDTQGSDNHIGYIAGAANIGPERFADYAERADYIRALLTEIRSRLRVA